MSVDRRGLEAVRNSLTPADDDVVAVRDPISGLLHSGIVFQPYDGTFLCNRCARRSESGENHETPKDCIAEWRRGLKVL